MKKNLSCIFAWRGWIFENHTLKALNIPFKKEVLPGRVKCDDPEEEIVVAHGRLPFPACVRDLYPTSRGKANFTVIQRWRLSRKSQWKFWQLLLQNNIAKNKCFIELNIKKPNSSSYKISKKIFLGENWFGSEYKESRVKYSF